MGTADDILAQRINERAERRQRREELEKLLHDEAMKGSPRYMRAMQFSLKVMAMLNKFVPDACMKEAHEELMLNAIGLDVEIVQVPLERDAQNAARMEEAMMQVAAPIIIPKN